MPVAHGVGDLCRVLADDTHAHRRVACPELLDEAAEQVVVRAAERAERDRAAGDVAHLAHGLLRGPRGVQRALGLREQQPPCLGELEPPAGAREQRHAELRFKPSDLVREARLRHHPGLRGGWRWFATGAERSNFAPCT